MVGAIYKFKYFIFCQQKNTGKMARAQGKQGKHREFGINWSVATLFLGGLSLHLNHLIAERVSAPYWQFGTLPIGIFLSNLDSGQLETSLMTSYCHF